MEATTNSLWARLLKEDTRKENNINNDLSQLYKRAEVKPTFY